MPELRSRARRDRASVNPNPKPNPIDILPKPDTNTGKNKSSLFALARGEPDWLVNRKTRSLLPLVITSLKATTTNTIIS
ncbi:hypothetical protein J1N35_032403 [Gossypium stocksii]|uniref:Uncharacterized protein n=1 Tax=Gossypium stocksii TaxID=47602 RepID=A0A9D3ZUN7_9ROSI|nr:hypothetical protein J1N35_032403 [Gossypium stocksii]